MATEYITHVTEVMTDIRYKYILDLLLGILIFVAIVIFVQYMLNKLFRDSDFYWDVRRTKVRKFLKQKGFDLDKELMIEEAFEKMKIGKQLSERLEEEAFKDILPKETKGVKLE